MTQENQTNEESQENKMESLYYHRRPFLFADWRSPKRVSNIMNNLAGQVVRVCLGNNGINYKLGREMPKPDLKVELTTSDWTNWKKLHSEQERGRRAIGKIRVYDVYGSIDAKFVYYPASYHYCSCLEEDREMREWRYDEARRRIDYMQQHPKLESRAEILGEIKYNPQFFNRPEDVERLMKIVKKKEGSDTQWDDKDEELSRSLHDELR